MNAIKIYAKDSKFYMEDLNNNTTVELTEFVDDGKTLKLPENSANRKYCAVKKAEETVTLEYKATKTFGPKTGEKSTVTKKFDWTKYLTDDEKKIIDEIKAKCEERAQKDIKQAKIDAMKAEIAKLMKEIEG